LPCWLDVLKVENIKIGSASVDAEFRRAGRNIVINILEKRGRVDVIIRK
jgi:hypothetical protein